MRTKYFRYGGVRTIVREYSGGAIISIFEVLDWKHDRFEDAIQALHDAADAEKETLVETNENYEPMETEVSRIRSGD